MKAKSGQDQDILKQVKRSFSKFRSGWDKGKEQRYSQEVKQSALSAVESGLSILQVALAARVNSQSVRNWRKSILPHEPSELKVVQDHNPEMRLAAAPISQNTEMARISFCSGAVLELSVSSLSQVLIVALNGGRS